jgi:hypothetical protein
MWAVVEKESIATDRVNLISRNVRGLKNKKIEKKHTARPAGLKTRRSLSYTIITKSPCFDCAVSL